MMDRKDRKAEWNEPPREAGPPDFSNLLAVLRREKPKRPTLFEFLLNGPLSSRLAGTRHENWSADISQHLAAIYAFRNAGYDFAVFRIPEFNFPAGEIHVEATRSLNEGGVITDRTSFESYSWPDSLDIDYSILDRLAPEIPEGMKLVIYGPCGVLENVVMLVGYDRLCYMITDERQLACDIFEAVGSRLGTYYENCLQRDAVGAIIGNDDWGFKSQTLLSPDDLRCFVFPWHEKIVSAAHAAGKPAILHSCGCVTSVMDDIVDVIGYDGKHSFEDAIQPVENAYDQYHDRIAILGGIDVDFLCRSTPVEVYRRSKAMVEKGELYGAYALGTGNSVPKYVPDENYFAMIRAALESR